MGCACAGDIVEAEVGADMGLGGSGGTGMAGVVGVGGRDDGRHGVCCCCIFTPGLLVINVVHCGVLVRRVGEVVKRILGTIGTMLCSLSSRYK